MPRNFLPPEWAPQSAVMLTWPRADGDFARHFEAVEANFVAIAVAISQHQEVHINYGLDPANLRERLIQAGAHPARLRVYRVESDDVWARDHGPITVIRDGRLVHLDFTFNGWGNKFSAERDNQLTRKLAGLGAWSAPVETVDFVLEGGGIEVDGCGALLTTERCLLAPTRNPQLTREGIEAVLKREFGIERVLWLKHGDLLGDDTDGHVDTIARFCDAHTIAYQGCSDPSDAHYEDLKGLAEELAALRTRDGSPYDLVELPLPAPIYDEDGQRLPAGYANFLIMNNVVLVPIYGDANDEPALSKLREVFEDRQVIGIDCRALILQYGGLHCVTMQIPQAPARG
ncbi:MULTISPECIES: agmatine deiminase family protein [Hydrocarboniphaga]|jgi:agmatine/peptidylarginine deiminase|uniref:Agmatine deiminase n=1 Tax=Hydrocarboniphaga effusa AP103 TaxID=1172194 RepID=I8T4K1_9GAMM|nr:MULTISPECIES: agmatine deiminase family protein [Hydrocarboniphaga]EIT68648.1 Agmatine deiminase [Hydrocarboniphaga effusa AP103]MDZ4076832.1 agmatine deiminase family protein [Hydrocarboniphaga sp.]